MTDVDRFLGGMAVGSIVASLLYIGVQLHTLASLLRAFLTRSTLEVPDARR